MRDGPAHTGGRAGRGLDPDRPFPGQAGAFAPAPWTQFLSLLLSRLCLSFSQGGDGRRGEALHSEAPPRRPPGAQSPDCTLLSCMSRLAPFFSSKRVASTLLTAAAQCRADFPAREKSRVSGQGRATWPTPGVSQHRDVHEGVLSFPERGRKPVLRGDPWGKPGHRPPLLRSRNTSVQAACPSEDF